MKTKSNPVRLLFATAVFGALASFASAGPGPRHWEALRTEAQFKQLKAGEKISYVCNECKTVSEVSVKSPEHSMELCKEGASLMCPACKTKSTVIAKGQRNDPPTRTEVVYTNAMGEECGFYVKGSAGLQPLTQEAQFHSLKAGDQVAYVCNVCKTVSDVSIKSHDHAMELCKVGATVMCPSCKKESKIVAKGKRNDPPTRTEVIYTNEKGEECGFFAMVPEKK
ncbi:MAG TPA: hypothetical protein VHO24_02070 [Opitutaceae bacterium]|nr:hypothetical protein [Opitutaceae bacterium]